MCVSVSVSVCCYTLEFGGSVENAVLVGWCNVANVLQVLQSDELHHFQVIKPIAQKLLLVTGQLQHGKKSVPQTTAGEEEGRRKKKKKKKKREEWWW